MSIARQFVSVGPEQKQTQEEAPTVEAKPAPLSEKPKSNRGRKKSPSSEATLKPWEAEGVSRNTWYIRKRERKIFEEGIRIGKKDD